MKPLTTLEFGPWLPDQPNIENPGLVDCENVVPLDGAYSSIGAATEHAGALDYACAGAIAVYTGSGDAFQGVVEYAGDLGSTSPSTSGKLYKRLSSASVWSDATRTSGGGYTLQGTNAFWQFTQYGNYVIGVSQASAPQVIDIDSGANFANLGGSPPSSCRWVTTIGEHLVFGDLTGESRRNAVRWSGAGDHTVWGENSAARSGSQDLISSGFGADAVVTGLVGAQFYGIVFQRNAIWRMDVDQSLVFRLTEVNSQLGAFDRTVVAHGNRAWFWDRKHGFFEIVNGTEVISIGEGSVNNYINSIAFVEEYDAGPPIKLYLPYQRFVGAYDLKNDLVVWSIPTSLEDNDSDNHYSHLLVFYNWQEKRWSYATVNTEYVYGAIETEESYPVGPQLRVFTENHQRATFTGAALSTTLETGDVQLFRNENKRAFVTGARPIVEGAANAPTIALGTKNLPEDTPSFTSDIARNATTGISYFRSDARYHRGRLKTTGNFDHIVGMDVFAQPSGER